MNIMSVRVIGFQSFDDTGLVEFASGINLIVGANNSGKSALIRALQPALADDRHRSPTKWETFRLAAPEVHLEMSFSGQELESAVLLRDRTYFPIRPEDDVASFMDKLFSEETRVCAVRRPNSALQAEYPGHLKFTHNADETKYVADVRVVNAKVVPRRLQNDSDNTASVADEIWSRQMFYFTAERMNIGESPFGRADRLTPNASNLPNVLMTLNGDRGDIFQTLVRHLREIFPTVGNVSVRASQNNQIEIRVWPTVSMERVELSFPLTQSGTGVSQVIAILTAAMTLNDALIVIDEINSFLHPAAVKALLRILQSDYNHHQYIISTHAPEVIGFSNPSTIHLVRREGYISKVEKLTVGDVDAFRTTAQALGVSMADVFAAERVVWVEGATEELCFPTIYQEVSGKTLPRGTTFTSVVATGDFNAKRRDKELVYQIYQRLSEVAYPLVGSTAFSFDSEHLTESDKSKMMKESGGRLRFLPRRHLECYLLDPAAIANFISERDFLADNPVAPDVIAEKLHHLSDSVDFRIAQWKGNLNDPTWQAAVDAANLISRTCSDHTDGRVVFNKKNDTLTLLRLVLKDNPGHVSELAEYVISLVETA